MTHYTPLKLLYVAFLGLMLALFTGVVISVSYPGPKNPEELMTPKRAAPTEVSSPGTTPSATEIAIQEENDRKWKEFRDKQKTYDRNVSLISLAAAIVMLVTALSVAARLDVIADGILLGSVFTMLYSIIRGFSSESQWLQLVVTTIGLVLAFTFGYLKFLKPDQK